MPSAKRRKTTTVAAAAIVAAPPTPPPPPSSEPLLDLGPLEEGVLLCRPSARNRSPRSLLSAVSSHLRSFPFFVPLSSRHAFINSIASPRLSLHRAQTSAT
jgi:hypothetical protein